MCNFLIFRAHSAHRPSAPVSAHRVHRSHPPRIFPETWTMRRARSGPTTSLADEPHEPWPADTSGQELEQAPGSFRSWGRRSRRGWSWRSCWARTATSTSEPWTRTRRTPARSSSNKIEARHQSQWTTSSAKQSIKVVLGTIEQLSFSLLQRRYSSAALLSSVCVNGLFALKFYSFPTVKVLEKTLEALRTLDL